MRGLSKSLLVREALGLLLTPPDKAECNTALMMTKRDASKTGATTKSSSSFTTTSAMSSISCGSIRNAVLVRLLR
jgi:hypothetical protein